MKKLIGLFIVVIIFSFASVAEAESEWRGVEIMTTVSAQIELTPRLALQGTVAHFYAPLSHINMFFSYFGVSAELFDWYRVSIFVGAVINFPQEYVNAFDFSIWNMLIFLDGGLTIFIESDMIFSSEGYDYYGFYALNFNFNFNRAWLNIGAHIEQVNMLSVVGPQAGITVGPWHGEIQYNIGMQEENFGYAIRVVNALNF